MSTNLSEEDKKEVFGSFDPDKYSDETKEKYGHTNAYKQSQQKTKNYTKEDWANMALESDFIVQKFKNLMEKGIDPESSEAKEAAEAHRQHITKWFYNCDYEIHSGLALMYISDERFKENYEKHARGLAQYIHDAITANSLDNM
jgi:membrane-associated HD superfamily phosphohydrolase